MAAQPRKRDRRRLKMTIVGNTFETMIGYFLKADRTAADKIRPLLWGDGGIARTVDSKMKGNFGVDLELMLIELLADGPLSLGGVPTTISKVRLSKKDKTVSVKVPLRSSDGLLEEEALKTLLIVSTCAAIDVIAISAAGKVDTDFDAVKAAFLSAVNE